MNKSFKTTPLQEVPKVNNIYRLNSSGDCTCSNKKRTGGAYHHNGVKVCKHEYYKEVRTLESKLLIREENNDYNKELIHRKTVLQLNEKVFDLESENAALKQQIKSFQRQVKLLQLSLDPSVKNEVEPWGKI